MLKKYFIFILALALLMFFTGCSKTGAENTPGKNSSNTSTQGEKYYGYERKEYKAGMDPEVDAAVAVAKEWYYARAVQGDLAKEFDLLAEGAKQGASTKEKYVQTVKQESDRPGWEVKKENDGEVKKITVENSTVSSIGINIYTPDNKVIYGIWIVKEVGAWKVNGYNRHEIKQ